MRTNQRPALAPTLLAALACALAVPSVLDAASFEKTIPPPKTARANLGWASGGCSVLSVTLRNYPNEEDIEKARTKDPNDNSWVWWDFHVENRGDTKCKISIAVEIFDKSGKVVKSSDKTDTVDGHKMDDNIRLSTRMRTLDIVDSPKAHIKAEIGPR
jgi:hypothetical protein